MKEITIEMCLFHFNKIGKGLRWFIRFSLKIASAIFIANFPTLHHLSAYDIQYKNVNTQDHGFYLWKSLVSFRFFKSPTTKEQYGSLRYAVLVPVTPILLFNFYMSMNSVSKLHHRR